MYMNEACHGECDSFGLFVDLSAWNKSLWSGSVLLLVDISLVRFLFGVIHVPMFDIMACQSYSETKPTFQIVIKWHAHCRPIRLVHSSNVNSRFPQCMHQTTIVTLYISNMSHSLPHKSCQIQGSRFIKQCFADFTSFLWTTATIKQPFLHVHWSNYSQFSNCHSGVKRNKYVVESLAQMHIDVIRVKFNNYVLNQIYLSTFLHIHVTSLRGMTHH